MFDHDDEIIRRPLLVTLAAFIWYVVGALLIAGSVGFLILLTLMMARIEAGPILCFALVTGTINIPIGLSCIYLARRLYTGGYVDVLGFGIASFVLGFILATLGINGLIVNYTRSPLISTLYVSVAFSTVGNWLLLAGLFVIVSRRRYIHWSRTRRIKTFYPDLLDDV